VLSESAAQARSCSMDGKVENEYDYAVRQDHVPMVNVDVGGPSVDARHLQAGQQWQDQVEIGWPPSTTWQFAQTAGVITKWLWRVVILVVIIWWIHSCNSKTVRENEQLVSSWG
jgi:hypothetical protein